MAQLNCLQSSVLVLLLSCGVQGCLYEYAAHPMTNLSCNPFGSSLKLYCSVIGPLHPQFHIQWHRVTAADQTLGAGSKLGTDNDVYQVVNTVLNEVGDVEMEERSIISVLTTGLLSDVHQNQCISCRVEFDGQGVSLSSNNTKLCLGSAASYGALPSCSEDFIIRNSTAVCVTSQDFLEPPSSLSPSPSQPLLIPTPTLSASLPTSLTMLPPASFPTSMPTLMHHPTTAFVLPSPSTIAPSPSNSTASGGNPAAVEGGLIVAIVICIIFIVIIIILMYFVVRLFRQWRWNRKKQQHDGEATSDVDGTVPPRPAVALARGYSVERFPIDSESLFLNEVGTISATRSLQDLSRIQTVPPIIPPRPWRDKMVKASSASALNTRGLSHGAASVSLVRGYNNFILPDSAERPIEDPDIPPPIPVRSKSRDHFYHTLECPENDDSGIVSECSPQYSQHRSTSITSSNQTGQEDEQAQQLFDDPRYVALQVEREGILRERKEIWRSTPALATMNPLGRGGSDRRSLRLTHVVGTEIYS